MDKAAIRSRLHHAEVELAAKRKEETTLKETYRHYKSAFLYAESLKQKAADWKKRQYFASKGSACLCTGPQKYKKTLQ